MWGSWTNHGLLIHAGLRKGTGVLLFGQTWNRNRVRSVSWTRLPNIVELRIVNNAIFSKEFRMCPIYSSIISNCAPFNLSFRSAPLQMSQVGSGSHEKTQFYAVWVYGPDLLGQHGNIHSLGCGDYLYPTQSKTTQYFGLDYFLQILYTFRMNWSST